MPATYAHVACPACGTPLRGSDMSLQAMAGRCHACDALVDLRAVAPSLEPTAADGPADGLEPLPVPLPPGIHVEDRGRDLVIVRRWFSWVYIFLLLFCAVWDGMLIFFYGVIFAAGTPTWVALFPVLHVAAGVFITYFTIAGLVNRTTFTIERDRLSVRHGPLPWRGNVDVSTDALAQLYCTEQEIRGRNGVTLRYGVDAALRDGGHLKLASGLDAREQALYIEQGIEKHLGIPDRRVRSEMRR